MNSNFRTMSTDEETSPPLLSGIEINEALIETICLGG